MKIEFAFVFALLIALASEPTGAQSLTVSSSHLDFGDVYENAPDSLALTINNNLGHDVLVTGIKFYDTYGIPAFSASTNNFSIPDGSSQLIWIRFSPRHNIYHNSEMVIYNNALRGTVSVNLTGQGKYSMSYYNATENQSEENLKNVIHTITGINYDTLGYNFARDSMFMWLDNQRTNGQGASQNTVECIYTGRIASGYISRQDVQNLATYSFNTEHTFPQGFFPPNPEPMRSDLHHLFPTDDDANNFRGNKPFGVVTNPTWSVGGSSGTATMFEPRDQQKGQTARAMMYFVLRYQDYTNFFAPQEQVLRTWHHDFQPGQLEKKRNDDINIIQHNRNPFVDYPQFIERINAIIGLSVAPTVSLMDLTQDTIVYGFVQASTPHVFHYVIVNDGNVNIQLNNFNLSDPGVFSFQSGGNDTAIAPGEALGINIRLLTTNQNALHDSLMFHSNVPGHAQVTIPIYANDPLINSIHGIQDNNLIQLFPNPANEKIMVRSASLKMNSIRILDLLGREVANENFRQSPVNSWEIDVNHFHSGIYFLLIQSDEKILTEKFMKQ